MKLHSFLIGLSPFVLLHLAGCVASNHDSSHGFPLKTLAKGAQSGIKQERQLAIRERQAWQTFWREHSSEESPPHVNFNKEMVLAVTMGQKRTGGFAIEITEAEPTGNALQVKVTMTTPPPGGMTIQVLTSPFHFVTVPKTGSNVRFVKDQSSPP